LSLPAFADDEAHIKDLASRYDFVGIVTGTSVLKWNMNPDSGKMEKIYSTLRPKLSRLKPEVREVNQPEEEIFSGGFCFLPVSLFCSKSGRVWAAFAKLRQRIYVSRKKNRRRHARLQRGQNRHADRRGSPPAGHGG
jgi:hypothetical protein